MFHSERLLSQNLIRLSLALCALATAAEAQVAKTVKWACIGNSITQGPSATDAYPAKLAKLLGVGYSVENDGVSGKTLLKAGDFSYWTQGKLANVFAFKPDIITIKLGTNDSKPINWDAHSGEFEKDYLALIDTLAAMPSKPTIWILLPVPAFSDGAGATGIRGTVIKNEILPLVKKIAAARGLNTVDLYTPMLTHQAFFADNVHPNAEGHDSIAALIYRAYLAKSTRVACIGNSITEGAGVTADQAYPIKLGNLLGRSYYAVNYGKSGAYMQKVSPFPYWSTGLLQKVIAFKPNIVTIKLGTNDSRADYWHADKFTTDYKTFLDSLNTINPKPKIYMCMPVPAWQRNGVWPFNGISDDIIKGQTIPTLTQIAKDKSIASIDLYNPMKTKEALVPDGVHPNAEGLDTLAHIIYRVLTAPVVSLVSASARAYPEVERQGDALLVSLPGSSEAVATLYALDGRALASAAVHAGVPARITTSGYAPGRYFLAVEANHPEGTTTARSVKPISL